MCVAVFLCGYNSLYNETPYSLIAASINFTNFEGIELF